jgi:hypothetical protein
MGLFAPGLATAWRRPLLKSASSALPVQGLVRRTVLVTLDMPGEESFRVLHLRAQWAKLPQVAPKQLPA